MKSKIIIIHAADDLVIPIYQSEKVYLENRLLKYETIGFFIFLNLHFNPIKIIELEWIKIINSKEFQIDYLIRFYLIKIR